ncbi:hypothetical protein FK216_15580 [Moraxellaceae bacterium AER2_44_116]|nr:hypothetical protein FK216_15580 [Moraxellaceae bacterium AER2_44_116]
MCITKKVTPKPTTQYDFSGNQANVLSVAINLPLQHRVSFLAEQMSPDNLLLAFANFIGMANSVSENTFLAVEQILVECGVTHPDRLSGANLPTLTGALNGYELSQGISQKRTCKGCAYRKGTPANQSLITTTDASYCIDSYEDFHCHEKLDDNGQPVKLCAGHVQHKKHDEAAIKKAILAIGSEV